jgi:hypothetical protein
MTLSRRPFNDLRNGTTERGNARGTDWIGYITGRTSRLQSNRVVYHS